MIRKVIAGLALAVSLSANADTQFPDPQCAEESYQAVKDYHPIACDGVKSCLLWATARGKEIVVEHERERIYKQCMAHKAEVSKRQE